MEALLQAVVLVNLHLAGCVWLPGIAWRLLFPAVPDPEGSLETRPGNWAMQALALGALWAGGQLLLIFGWLRPMWDGTPVDLLGAVHASNLTLVAAVAFRRRGELRDRLAPLRNLWRIWRRWDIGTGILLAALVSAFAIVQFPYAMDNSALYWVSHATANPEANLKACEGALAYLGWLYWPSLLAWPDLAPATIGTAAKLPLNLLALFAIRRLCALHPATNRPGIHLLVYLGALTAFIGDYGLLQTGKETVFSILFLFASLATLMRDLPGGRDEDRDWTAAGLLALAIGTGSISVPYGAIFVALALHLAGPPASPSRLAFKLALAIALPAAFAFATMLRLPLAASLAAWAVLILIIRFVPGPIDGWFRLWYRLHRGPRRRAGECVLLLGSMAAVALLFPVHFDPISYYPLDGKAGFSDLFLRSWNNGVLPPYVGFVAIAGMLSVLLPSRDDSPRGALVALFAFPFVTLLPSLLVIRHGNIPLPFAPLKLWDLVKDIPNWCWGILANFAAFFLLVRSAGLLEGRLARFRPRWISRPGRFGAAFVGVVAAGHFGLMATGGRLAVLTRWNQAPLLTSVGGNRTPEMALMSEKLVQRLAAMPPGSAGPLMVEMTSVFAGRYWDLNGSGLPVVKRPYFDPAVQPDALETEEEDTFFLIAKRDRLIAWWREGHGASRHWEELIGFPDGDSLLHVRPLAPGETSPSIQLTELPPFGVMPQTFASALGLAPQVHWDTLAVAPLRTKEGDSYLWGGPSGTIWVALDRSPPSHPRWEIKARFVGGATGTLVITSPSLKAPVTLSPGTRQFKGPLELPSLPAAPEFYGRRWVPFHFRFEGELRYEAGFAYPKTYQIDRFIVFGTPFID